MLSRIRKFKLLRFRQVEKRLFKKCLITKKRLIFTLCLKLQTLILKSTTQLAKRKYTKGSNLSLDTEEELKPFSEPKIEQVLCEQGCFNGHKS